MFKPTSGGCFWIFWYVAVIWLVVAHIPKMLYDSPWPLSDISAHDSNFRVEAVDKQTRML
jgi:hypothetical protein